MKVDKKTAKYIFKELEGENLYEEYWKKNISLLRCPNYLKLKEKILS